MLTFIYHIVRNIKNCIQQKLYLLEVMTRLPKNSKVAGTVTFTGMVSRDKLSIGPKTIIEGNATIGVGNSKREYVKVGSDCRIRSGAQLLAWGGFVSIGNSSSVNANCVLYGTGGVTIGNCVRIAANGVIVSSSHNFEDTAVAIHDQGFEAIGITINDNVWIGANVTILDGVTIGTGAIIGAGSVVRSNVAPYSIVAGVPAKVIKMRKID